MGDDPKLESVRVDRWLWAARFFKTRGLATTACGAGHVKIGGQSAKASKALRRGDNIEAVTPGGERIIEVVGLAQKRGPAPVAQSLYVDHTPPPPPKEEGVLEIRRERGEGRPSKRDLRKIRRLRGY